MYIIKWRFLIRREKGESSASSQEKQQTIFGNYLCVSSLPICGKILERLIFNEMILFFIKYGLIL